jgi:hypothetical protein
MTASVAARTAEHGVPRTGTGAGVGVQGEVFAARRERFDRRLQRGDEARAVRAFDLRRHSQRRVAQVQRAGQLRSDQVVVDRVQALRAVRMAATHVMCTALRVAVEGGSHGA